MGKFGIGELALLLGLTLVIFGPKRLPELGKSFGKTLSGFREYANRHDEIEKTEDEDNEK